MAAGLIRPVNIGEEMREAYLDYAMSVIVARALPDARDGLKPVHRRILYAMYDMGLRPDSPFKKSARIVGEVLGKYHPHGDASVYEAMARMAQDFSMRYEIVDGQGNFGSIDGDAPAAMRYTEARTTALGFDLLIDIDKETIDYTDNFDGSLQEPAVLPSAVPNLLINGASGIAVGMSTSIPPHNLGEVCDALVYMLSNWDTLENVDVAELMRYIKGPDFPTGGLLFRQDKNGEDTLITAYATGRGKLTVRAKAHIENLGRGKSRIIVSEIPYQCNKNSLIERIADLVRDGRLDGISDLRDESDRQGLRIVVEVKSGQDPTEVLTNLFKLTPLEDTFSVIMLALVDGEPRTLSLKQALRVYLDHRLEVIRRRSEYDLNRALERAHILEGLLKALEHLNTVIKLIRESANADAARTALMERFKLSEIQANAILEMQLRRLAALERQRIEDEYNEKRKTIAWLEDLLANPPAMRKVVADELVAIKGRYNDPRRTVIVNSASADMSAGDLMAGVENTWVTHTVANRLSRTVSDAPPRITGQSEDAPRFVVPGSTADILYLIAEDGTAASVPVSQLSQSDDPSTGSTVNIVTALSEDAEVVGVLPISPMQDTGYVMFSTAGGDVKRIRIADLPGLTADTFTVMNVGNDKIISALLVEEEDEIILATKQAQAIRFKVSDVRPTGLPAGGMRGIKLADNVPDGVIGAGMVRPGQVFWTITAFGTAKCTPIEEYPTQGRAGSGVITMKLPNITSPDGLFNTVEKDLLAAAGVSNLDDTAVILTNKAKRFKVSKVKAALLTQRAKGGGAIMSVTGKERVRAVAIIAPRPLPPEMPEPGMNGTSHVEDEGK